MNLLVLDTWAVIAWLQNEAPASRMAELFRASDRSELHLAINIVNLGEVFYIIAWRRDIAHAVATVSDLRTRVRILSAADDLVMRAALLKARHRISYADGFAAATAIAAGVPLVTGDPELQAMATREPALRLEWIGA